MTAIAALAPLFLAFEIWQLIISERYLGLKQIARGADPATLGLHELTAFLWTLAILAYWVWMLLVLLGPTGRIYGVALILVSLAGYAARRGAPLKRVLVILTMEGAVRIGLLCALCATLWWFHR